jgi:hypothetical protein
VMLGLPAGRRGPLPGFPVWQARSAQAPPEASIAGYGLLHWMKILIENGPAAGAGDGFAPDLIQIPNLWSDALQRVAGRTLCITR